MNLTVFKVLNSEYYGVLMFCVITLSQELMKSLIMRQIRLSFMQTNNYHRRFIAYRIKYSTSVKDASSN